MKRLLLALLCSAPITCAQAITTSPLSALPVNNPMMLLVLAVLLVVVAFVFFKRKSLPLAVTPVLVLATAAVLWQVPALKAQVMLAFTNPGGETLPITVDYDNDSQSFSAADFTNNSGTALNIRRILLPTFEQCFPDGLVALTAPAAEAFTPCSEGQILRNDASCRVDVHSVCADLASAFLSAISVNPVTLVFTENATGIITVTNDVASPVAAQNIAATIPGGSNLSVQSTTCGASLAIGASCTITLTSATQEGPTTIAIAGSNTNTVNIDVTVTSQPQISITGPTQQNRVVEVGAGALSLEITNDAGSAVNANAITVSNNAACPNLTVDNSNCTSVAPGASCTLELSSSTPYGPCTITLSGSNTANSPTTLIAFSHLGGLVFEESGGSGKVMIDVAQELTSEWTSDFSLIPGAFSSDDGAANTNAIVAHAACSDDFGNCAAQRCQDISADWYLPAINELSAAIGTLCSNAAIPCNFGGFSSAVYWSSSSVDLSIALTMVSPSGDIQGASKTNFNSARCIRAFIP